MIKNLKAQFKTAGMIVPYDKKQFVKAHDKMYAVSAMKKDDWEALAALVFKTPKSNSKPKPKPKAKAKAKPNTTTKKPSHS